MNILLVSQCSKKALPVTRRVLDQFAERKGDRVWETAITQQGLITLRKMLRKKARRNTAVACHWIRGKNHSELLWIVGNLRKFNQQGTVPTNTTSRDILRSEDENNWHTAEAISLLAGIAGLFHDFGKANVLFQNKLKPKAKTFYEPVRHEWISLRLFQAFVASDGDSEWLARLGQVSRDDEPIMLEHLIKDNPEGCPSPFANLPPLARAIGWLIVSHHRLPKFNKEGEGFVPPLSHIDQWLTNSKVVTAAWNAPQFEKDDWKPADWKNVWTFKQGTPMRSLKWCEKAHSIAGRALKQSSFSTTDWMADRFSTHLARLNLMLADHCYSASDANTVWQDKKYKAWANTDRKTGKQKQKLDEHNIGVGHNAVLLSKSLPKIRQTLPAITRHKGFKQRSKHPSFRWQDKAYDLAVSLRDRSKSTGFFGVNMASTGRGKTFANARIMYGLSEEKTGCRFSVALGLRTLTLQTGDALQERLQLASDDLAVLIGSQAVRDLHRIRVEDEKVAQKNAVSYGSESADAFFEEHQYVSYDGSLDDGRLSQWLKQSPKLHQLLSAPVLVSTIDHLMPATEGERGGKQIAPMLRLLTSDLVLDEPDDFGLEDLPALTRLVNWAGMLGSRVLLSSATLPPALIQALFAAYQSGRKQFNAACGELGQTEEISCAWFDEFDVAHQALMLETDFADAHQAFVSKRIERLAGDSVLSKAALLPVSAASPSPSDAVDAMVSTLREGAYALHEHHHQVHLPTGKKVSIGLVRMANINPLVAVAQKLLALPLSENYRIHFCIYHSQHPLLVRSNMEAQLDAALTRHDEDALWEIPAIKEAVEERGEENQLFIVFGTSVTEVGRDHDYDWAVAEPSSIRSLIQLAGRIQRHRRREPAEPNLFILNKNYRSLKGEAVAYTRPGFESRDYPLHSHDLNEVLEVDQYQKISATPRIQARTNLQPEDNLVDLEHAHLQGTLFGSQRIKTHAALWWDHNATWSAEIQRRTPFRRSTKDEQFVLMLEEEGERAEFHEITESGEVVKVENSRFVRTEIELAEGHESWIKQDLEGLIEAIADRKDKELADASRTFAELRLRETEKQWCYQPEFGVYQPLNR